MDVTTADLSITKPAGATRKHTFDLARALEMVWRPGTLYTSGQYRRPPIPTGYEYECTTGGQSGAVDPANTSDQWATTVGDTTADGSVIWTCRAFATNATDTIASISVTADSGLTVDSSSYSGNVVTFTISGGTAGNSYDLVVEVTTAAGDVETYTFRVTITE